MTHYSLWKVIINGDSPKPSVVVEGSAAPAVVLTAEQNLARRNELKARGTLLMSLPEKHQFKFNSHKDAKTLMKEIEKRFEGNTETKKMAMLTMRTRRFLQKTGRNLGDNRVITMGFNMSKVKFYNRHRKGHFARECRSPKDTKRTVVAEPQRRHIPVETSTSNALVSQCDGIRSYDWSYQAEEELANFSFIAISSSSSSDNEVQSCSTACTKAYKQLHDQYDSQTVKICKSKIDVLSYQATLESVESRLVVYKQNESIFQDNIIVLKNEVVARDNYISNMRQKLKEAETKRDDLKLKFEKFQSSSKSLPELIASQSNNKHGLGYLPLEDVSANLSLNCPFDKVSDSEDESEHNDPQSALSFVQPSEQVKLSRHYTQPVEAPILAHTPKPTSSKTNGSRKRKNRKTCFVCRGVDHLIKDCTFHVKPKTHPTPRNYVHRGYDKQYTSSTKQYPKKHRVPAAVFTKSKLVSVTAARPVSVVVSKIMAATPRHARSLHTKTNSIIRRHQTPRKFSKASNSSLKVTAAHAKVVSAAKGKKEFSVPRTPQQNGIAKRKNRTLIEAARTMLADSLLPIPFWAEAVNTACYVQNRVLVTKPQNKTPYELLHGRSPNIGFMRPFGCLVTILNTLDSLSKFEEKVDEGFLFRYSRNSKAFRVFNSRTRIVQESLHVNFLENTPNIAGTGPIWLFDIDSLTRTMNYQPITTGNQTNPNAGDTTFDGTEHDFEDFSKDSSNDVSAASLIVPATGQNCSNSTNPISVAGPSNSNSSPTHGNSSLRDASQSSDVLAMKNIVYSDNENVCAEADFNNLESSITMSSMGELTFFLGLRVKQNEDGIFINQDKYVAEFLKKFGLTEGKSASTPIDTEKPLLKDPDGEDVDQCKKQTVVATSSTEDKYVAGTSCCAQVLWIQNQMLDYGLQALVDKKKVVVTKAAIRDALHLDDAEGVDCLPNEEIFNELARMGYEKPTTKLTFYKAFFSSQWKFLIHIILQSMSAKRTSWNEFSSAMASAVICPSIGRKFNFSKYIFESLSNEEEHGNADTTAEEPVTAVDDFVDQSIQSLTPLTPQPQKPQDIPSTSHVQSPPPQQQSSPPALAQGAHFPMSLLQEALDACAALARRVKHLEHDKVAQDLEILKLKSRRIESSADTIMEDVSNQGRITEESDKDEGAEVVNEQEKTKEVRDNVVDAQVEGRQANIYHIDMDHAAKVLSMQEDEPEIQEAVEVVTTTKLTTKVVAAVSETVSAGAVVQADIPTAPVNAAAVMTTTAPVKVAIPSTRRRRGVVIRDPEEESSAKTPTETTSKDKGKCILTPAQKAAKRRRLNKEAEDVEELKQHLEIVPNEDDDVFTEATPLARKVPVVDYQIIHIILLVERRYPLTMFTLEQMLNVVRHQVEEESEMSLELIRFTRQQLQEGQHS
nr:retrovirus-related Pol polyprotein from transposon TNT 1-94 [Tanacetum cinerariifolium]